MPWCPGCSYEYVNGVKKCPDCGLSLRKAPGLDEIKHRNRVWTIIRQVPDPVQAELMKNFLRANGFDAITKGGDSVGRAIFGASGNVGATVQILVPPDSASAAATLLRTDASWSEEELSDYMKEHGDLDLEDEEDFNEEDEVVDLLEPEDLVGRIGDDDDSF
jgi:hypothetical protein